jgi:hypothetical protein
MGNTVDGMEDNKPERCVLSVGQRLRIRRLLAVFTNYYDHEYDA